MACNIVSVIASARSTGGYISGPIHKPDQDLSEPLFADLGGVVHDKYGCKFLVDTDFAGNAEAKNKPRCQVGILALLSTVPDSQSTGSLL